MLYRTRRPTVSEATLPNASVISVSSVVTKPLPARHGPVRVSRGAFLPQRTRRSRRLPVA